ncbi:MAG: helix-turn-helix transcriptional regulator [Bacteroidia bacterium]|jgi:transcriptional regulator with XRE-family HTH domain|nr:helix-turn-helix transcriptional regulator [Bacteroidia bacterium]
MAKANLRKIIGKNVRKARLNRKITQEKAAEVTGFHYKYYQRIEAGDVNLTLDSLEAISLALKVGIKVLVSSK